jgi:hypothetical protein
MTLGWKTSLTDEVSEPFMRSGTMHIFAITGALQPQKFAVNLLPIFPSVTRSPCYWPKIPSLTHTTGLLVARPQNTLSADANEF